MNTQAETRIEIIESKIKAVLNPISVQIIDDSAAHAGHPGAQLGAGHYTVVVISTQFEHLSKLKRHQLVYSAIQDMIPLEIHALQIKALTPSESESRVI